MNWLSVKDSLPEPDQKVLFWVSWIHQFKEIGCLELGAFLVQSILDSDTDTWSDPQAFFQWAGGDNAGVWLQSTGFHGTYEYGGAEESCVTHWMPVPDPPILSLPSSSSNSAFSPPLKVSDALQLSKVRDGSHWVKFANNVDGYVQHLRVLVGFGLDGTIEVKGEGQWDKWSTLPINISALETSATLVRVRDENGRLILP